MRRFVTVLLPLNAGSYSLPSTITPDNISISAMLNQQVKDTAKHADIDPDKMHLISTHVVGEAGVHILFVFRETEPKRPSR